MTLRTLRHVLPVFGYAAFFTMVAAANTIHINNFSFETTRGVPTGLPLDSCGVGCSYSESAVPGWTTTTDNGTSGQFRPGNHLGNTDHFNYLTDGNTLAYSNGATLTQLTNATVQLGVVYNLQVDMGFRKGYPNPGAPLLVIGAWDSFVMANGIPDQMSGDWATYTATYTGQAADVGKSISVALYSPGSQGNWDNVRLSDSTVVPEPFSMLLLGSGLVGLALLKKKRA